MRESIAYLEFSKGLTVKMLVTQSCPIHCDPMDCSPPGSSVHGILQATILEWVAIPFFRGSFQPRSWTQVSCIAGRFFTIWAIRKALSYSNPSMPKHVLRTHPFLPQVRLLCHSSALIQGLVPSWLCSRAPWPPASCSAVFLTLQIYSPESAFILPVIPFL